LAHRLRVICVSFNKRLHVGRRRIDYVSGGCAPAGGTTTGGASLKAARDVEMRTREAWACFTMLRAGKTKKMDLLCGEQVAIEGKEMRSYLEHR
jgi:hypothetical protein